MSFEEFWSGFNKAPIKVDCPPVSFMRHWTWQGVVPCGVICTEISRVKIGKERLDEEPKFCANDAVKLNSSFKAPLPSPPLPSPTHP